MAKYSTDSKGNPRMTVWCRGYKTKTGKESYFGVADMNGKKVGISFIPSTAKVMTDRNGKSAKMCSVQLTKLPDRQEIQDSFSW